MNINALTDAVTNGIVYAGKCIPTNDTLAEPLGGPLGDFIGGFWGITPYVIIAMLVVLAFGGIVSALTDKAAKYFKGMMWVAGIAIGVWFIAMLIFVITGNQPEIEGCPF